jgi:hypothetical protein
MSIGNDYTSTQVRLDEALAARDFLKKRGLLRPDGSLSFDPDTGADLEDRNAAKKYLALGQRQEEYNTARAGMFTVRGPEYVPEIRKLVSKIVSDVLVAQPNATPTDIQQAIQQSADKALATKIQQSVDQAVADALAVTGGVKV